MSYVVALEAFHGPLDLLLYLIEENQLDIYDIPIARITDQYMAYLSDTGDWDLDRLGDFLIMASYLMQLKSRMLLPKSPLESRDPEDIGIDPRDELVRRLLSYKRYRQVANYLAAMEKGDTARVFYRQPEAASRQEELVADIKSLVAAYKSLRQQLKHSQQQLDIPSGDVDVNAMMSRLMLRLRQNKRAGMDFRELLDAASNRRELLGYFLALLELLRQHQVKAVQSDHRAEIRIYLRAGNKNVNA
jgi:segregation and condensation protein A